MTVFVPRFEAAPSPRLTNGRAIPGASCRSGRIEPEALLLCACCWQAREAKQNRRKNGLSRSGFPAFQPDVRRESLTYNTAEIAFRLST